MQNFVWNDVTPGSLLFRSPRKQSQSVLQCALPSYEYYSTSFFSFFFFFIDFTTTLARKSYKRDFNVCNFIDARQCASEWAIKCMECHIFSYSLYYKLFTLIRVKTYTGCREAEGRISHRFFTLSAVDTQNCARLSVWKATYQPVLSLE